MVAGTAKVATSGAVFKMAISKDGAAMAENSAREWNLSFFSFALLHEPLIVMLITVKHCGFRPNDQES